MLLRRNSVQSELVTSGHHDTMTDPDEGLFQNKTAKSCGKTTAILTDF